MICYFLAPITTYSLKGGVGSKTTYQHILKDIFTSKPWPKIKRNDRILSCYVKRHKVNERILGETKLR